MLRCDVSGAFIVNVRLSLSPGLGAPRTTVVTDGNSSPGLLSGACADLSPSLCCGYSPSSHVRHFLSESEHRRLTKGFICTIIAKVSLISYVAVVGDS